MKVPTTKQFLLKKGYKTAEHENISLAIARLEITINSTVIMVQVPAAAKIKFCIYKKKKKILNVSREEKKKSTKTMENIYSQQKLIFVNYFL